MIVQAISAQRVGIVPLLLKGPAKNRRSTIARLLDWLFRGLSGNFRVGTSHNYLNRTAARFQAITGYADPLPLFEA
jgi:hypothetical protein